MVTSVKRLTVSTVTCLFILLILIAQGAFCRTSVSSYDRLPAGDWTYNAMSKLASDGLVPDLAARVFLGDRLFSRMEMAGVLASVLDYTSGTKYTTAQSILISSLTKEFKPELSSIYSYEQANTLPASIPYKIFVTGHAEVLASKESDNAGIMSLTALGGRSADSIMGVTFADNRPTFFRETRSTSDPDIVFMRGFGKDLTWSIGREYFNWGPCYTGSLILSDNSGSLYGIRAAGEIDFGSLMGLVKITQFVSSYKQDGKDIYLVGRRYEKPLSRRWNAGIGEIAQMNEAPNPLILVMPFYLYQHLFLNDVDAHLNALYSLDMVYRTGGFELYGEFMVDDMSAPGFLGAGYDRPRKTGLTLGCYMPNVIPGKHTSSFRAEYTYVDRLTYEATRSEVPELAYVHDSFIIGHPIGPNATALYLRGEQYLTDKLSIILEYLNQMQKSDGDPPAASKGILSALLAYDITPGKSISLRIAPFEIKQPDEPKENGTLYELKASMVF